MWALAVVVWSGILGGLSTAKTNERTLAQTLLGKIMLLHLHPVNLTVQLAGFVVLFYGIWDTFNCLSHDSGVAGVSWTHVGMA